jgi:hypothetical protein
MPGIGRLLLFSGAAVCMIVVASRAEAGRLYGNLSYSYQRLITEPFVPEDTILENDTIVAIIPAHNNSQSDNLTQETAIINYEDYLFTKNRMRLGANLSRRKFPQIDYYEFRPIYYFDLKGFGYSISSNYSPYKRLSADAAGLVTYYQYYRDWRTTAEIRYNKWPSLGLTYNSNKNYRSDELSHDQTKGSNFVLQSAYTYKSLAYQAIYNNLRTTSTSGQGLDYLTRTLSGTAGFTRSTRRLGNFSASYNYYDNRQYFNHALSTTALTNSVNGMYSSPIVHNVSANASYSGRFYSATRDVTKTRNKAEVFAASAAYTPTGYLQFDAVKGYQISTDAGRNQITEYIALTSNVTRYIRKGVDTRFSYTRTIYQQFGRTIVTASGTENITVRGHRTVDTYYGSFALGPYNYIRTFLSGTITHDFSPIDEQQRYQSTGSIDTRFKVSPAIEGQFAFNSLFQGSSFRIGHSFSQNYNVGLTYTPRGNMNLNITYIHSTFNAANISKTGSLTGYVSYSFRHAFSAYVSVNRQEQSLQTVVDNVISTPTTFRPVSVNGQLQIYLSRKTTLVGGYLYTKSPALPYGQTVSKSYQIVVNIQI